MIALFRIVEMTSGSMVIDGLDISKLGLRDVRSALSIIPQDSILCRYFISAFNLHTLMYDLGISQSPEPCVVIWIPSVSTMTRDCGMLSNDHTSWIRFLPSHIPQRPIRTATQALLRGMPRVSISTARWTRKARTCRSVSVPLCPSHELL